MRELSRLKAIQAFEAVARNGSYVRAADEMHVTPAAIGQQVRSLEAWLGMALFHRLDSGASRLVPTEKAKLALADFEDGFDRLDRGLRRLRAATRETLTISASQAFVAKWLMARLDSFTQLHPALEVRLDVTDRVVDVTHGDADVGIRCGPGGWPGLTVTRLMSEEVFPVCAPGYLSPRERGLRGLRSLAETKRLILIHDATAKTTSAFPAWSTWLQHAGMPPTLAKRGIQINASAAVIQAAINGQGIALARAALVRDDIANGLLVRLFPKISLPIEWAYYLVHSEDAQSRAQVQAFLEWIVLQARASYTN